MEIAFVHHQQAFLPELAAYQQFFNTRNITSRILSYGEEKESGADVLWYLMGFYPRATAKNKIIIHEYSSSSVPPYRKLKDFLKSRISPKPDFRIYGNDYVRQQINIHDEIPFGYRDMGVGEYFRPPAEPEEKSFDFIYTGSLAPQRKLNSLLQVFESGSLKNKTLLLLGDDQSGLHEKFQTAPNIMFQAPVEWHHVPEWLAKAKYALNYIPDEEPFNAQTSTKFLEYAAMKIPVISTNYFWISEFQERYGGSYFLLKDNLANLTWDRVTHFPYEFPDLQSWSWEERIKASGILEFLSTRKSGF